MRILGFSKKWDKLNNSILFTTFRFARKDKDWQVGEQVKIVYKPRSKGGGEVLGVAKIIGKTKRSVGIYGDKTGRPLITDKEAIADGFPGYEKKFGVEIKPIFQMWEFLWDAYGGERLLNEPMNKLTLRWIERLNG